MTKRPLILITIASCTFIALQSSFAATIPAGTTLIVRTLETIHSDDSVGKIFTAQFDHDIVVNGKAVLRAGTKVLGRIEVSLRNARDSRPLTLNLTGVSVNGRTIPIKTVTGFRVENKSMIGARHGGTISVSPFVTRRGIRMEFRLAQPLDV
jgi:hypothetical protein